KGKEIKKYGQGCIADTLTQLWPFYTSTVVLLQCKEALNGDRGWYFTSKNRKSPPQKSLESIFVL
ncbi:hypothetical protein, partial [Prevotella sp.]|uniref:hypothetical protein n=1 Tax=Prevotella sp. TaxID=59823 RepID=UPI00307B2F1A